MGRFSDFFKPAISFTPYLKYRVIPTMGNLIIWMLYGVFNFGLCCIQIPKTISPLLLPGRGEGIGFKQDWLFNENAENNIWYPRTRLTTSEKPTELKNI